MVVEVGRSFHRLKAVDAKGSDVLWCDVGDRAQWVSGSSG